jgi:hypothetical protein
MQSPQRSPTTPATSEVAQLLRRIDDENQAAHAALHGLASGTARHEVITAHMAHIEDAAAQLIDALGSDQALPLIVARLEQHS